MITGEKDKKFKFLIATPPLFASSVMVTIVAFATSVIVMIAICLPMIAICLNFSFAFDFLVLPL